MTHFGKVNFLLIFLTLMMQSNKKYLQMQYDKQLILILHEKAIPDFWYAVGMKVDVYEKILQNIFAVGKSLHIFTLEKNTD